MSSQINGAGPKGGTAVPGSARKAVFWEAEELQAAGASSKAIAEVRSRLKRASANYRNVLYHELGRCVHLARFLASQPNEWDELCEVRPLPPSRNVETALALVLHCVFEPASRIAKQRASKFRIALAPIARGNTPADQIPSLIKSNGGINRMAKPPAKNGAAVAVDVGVKDVALLEDDDPARYFFLYANADGVLRKLNKLRTGQMQMIFDLERIQDDHYAIKVVSASPQKKALPTKQRCQAGGMSSKKTPARKA